MKRKIHLVDHFFCAIGFHKYRERISGKATERVCMRADCEHREKLYAVKGKENLRFFNKKTVHNHDIKKVLK